MIAVAVRGTVRREKRLRPCGWVSSSVRVAWPSRTIVKPNRNQQRSISVGDERKPWEIPVQYNDDPVIPRQADPVAPEDAEEEELEGEEIYDEDDEEVDDVDDGDDWDEDIDEVS